MTKDILHLYYFCCSLCSVCPHLPPSGVPRDGEGPDCCEVVEDGVHVVGGEGVVAGDADHGGPPLHVVLAVTWSHTAISGNENKSARRVP